MIGLFISHEIQILGIYQILCKIFISRILAEFGLKSNAENPFLPILYRTLIGVAFTLVVTVDALSSFSYCIPFAYQSFTFIYRYFVRYTILY